MRSSMLVTVVAFALACGACGGSDSSTSEAAVEIGPFGPPLGVSAPVVRAAVLKTTGAITTEMSGEAGDDETGLRGLCDPSMFANFGIDLPPGDYYRLQVTLTSDDPIPTGATGTFDLDRLDVSFTTKDIDSLQFVGPGTLTLMTHDATPGRRRMTGTMSGSSLEGRQDADGKTLDATLAFDMDFSCGLRE